jgi:hypothetical protein
MDQLDHLASRYRGDGFGARELLRDDREWAACWACRKKHPLRGNNADHDYQDFAARHRTENGCVVLRIGPDEMRRVLLHAQRRKRLRHDAILGFSHNASILEAFQSSSQSVDLTGLNSLASSVTAGWCSAWVDNSTNLYLDYLYYVNMAAVNTATSSQKAHFAFCTGSHASADLPSNTAGNTVTNSSTTGATLTFNDITANPVGFALVRIIPYVTTNKPINSGCFGIAKAFDGWVPLFHWLPYVNAAGPTIAAASNAIKYRGVYTTAA